MRPTTQKFHELLRLLKGSYLESYYGLYNLRKAQKTDPEICPFAIKGEKLFYEEEYEQFVELCRQIVSEHDRK